MAKMEQQKTESVRQTELQKLEYIDREKERDLKRDMLALEQKKAWNGCQRTRKPV